MKYKIEKNAQKYYYMSKIQGIDRVNDAPENALLREVDNIKSCQNRMRQTLEQVNHQIGENRNARHILERDLQNKDHAIGIDHSCHQVKIL